ncbi:hypothetical protein ACOSQ3_031221 [Xanthoceras sorbifolium]
MSSQVAYSTNKKIKIRIKGRKLESSSSLGSGVVDIKLMELLKCIMEDNDGYGIYLAHWRLSIRKVSTPENIKISDKHLLYIAERTIGLEELDLLGSSRITGAGFAKANMQLEKCQICYEETSACVSVSREGKIKFKNWSKRCFTLPIIVNR